MLKAKKSEKKLKSFTGFILFVLILLTLTFIFVDSILRPQVVTMARYRLQSMATWAANQAIIEQMEISELSYGDLISVERDDYGELSLLSYNSLEVNRLKSQITSSVIEKINRMDKADIYIPIGNITNIDFLQNKGPRLKFRITPSAYVETDIESEFENTGINQVNHRIFIVIKVGASALIPNYPTDINFSTRVCVAQTVIVGKVPNNIYESLGHY